MGDTEIAAEKMILGKSSGATVCHNGPTVAISDDLNVDMFLCHSSLGAGSTGFSVVLTPDD